MRVARCPPAGHSNYRTGHTATVSALTLAHALDVGPECHDVVIDAKALYNQDDVLARDHHAVVTLALLFGLIGDNADELQHALLDQLLGILGDLGVGQEHPVHDAYHACKGSTGPSHGSPAPV
jgi:hypothetical protein